MPETASQKIAALFGSKPMKILSIVGARPQFIKAWALSPEIRRKHEEVLVHTGQHYDYKMSGAFFKELDIPEPDYNLEVAPASQNKQTAEMLVKLEDVIIKEKPDWVMVYGDTTSTLAGALAAAKLHVPVAHVEAGLRSFNKEMPEEINRIVADHCSSLLFCPTKTSVENLRKEGVTQGVHLVGDVMEDALRAGAKIAEKKSKILAELKVAPKKYLLVTVHRQANTDVKEKLQNIVEALAELAKKWTVVFPVHPRTKKMLQQFELEDALKHPNIKLVEPVGYVDMLWLEKNAFKILTDSGGVQREAVWFGVPCIVLRDETEWMELVEKGKIVVVGVKKKSIVSSV